MPIYAFTCHDCGGTFDARAGYDQAYMKCDACGGEAQRESVYRVNFGGFASTPQGKTDFTNDYRRFTEASSEMDYKATRLESEGAPVATPKLFKAAKHEARKMAAAGVTADHIST